MRANHPWSIYLRALLAGLLIALLGLAPRIHEAQRAMQQARLSIQAGDFLPASTRLAETAHYFPWRADLYLLAGRYALQGGAPELAINYLERHSIVNHLAPSDLMLLGDAYLQSGDRSMALAIWQRVTELAPLPEAHQRRYEQFLIIGNYASAAQALQSLISLQPSNPQLIYQLSLLYAAVDPLTALPYLELVIEQDLELAPSARQLERAIRTADRTGEAAYTYTSAGRGLAQVDEWLLAVEAFRNAVELRPDYAEAWAFLGEALQQVALKAGQTRPESGYLELRQAIHLDPSSIAANLLMSTYWQRQGDLEQSRHYIDIAITVDPSNPILYAELGNTLAGMGLLPDAQSAYLQAIQLAPNDPLFYRILAEYALHHQIQLRELALPAARQAVLLAPDDPRSLALMGQTLLALGDSLNAERFLLRSLQNDPLFAPAHLHLGLVYLYRSNPQLARQELRLAQALAPGTWTADQAERLLAYYFP